MTRNLGDVNIVASLRVLSALGLLGGPPTFAQLKSGSCNEYRGTLGKNTQIGMSLYGNDRELQGSYFYKNNLKDIPLRGKYTGDRDISLIETDRANHPRGTFQLHFAEHDSHFPTADPLQAEVLQGEWIGTDGKTTYPVYLQLDHECAASGQSRYAVAGATSDQAVEENIQAFYQAVVAGNRSAVANYVSYPATYFAGAKRKQIAGSAALLNVYNQIFTPAFVAQIAKSVPHHMFVNSQGIMLADGKVWFAANGKAKHFNNQAQ